MAANPKSASSRLPPTVPPRAPSTHLSTIHPAQSAAGSLADPSAVMLKPLHQAHRGKVAAMLSQPIEYSFYQGQETSVESHLGPAEIKPTPGQEVIIEHDPVLTVEAKSNEKVY